MTDSRLSSEEKRIHFEENGVTCSSLESKELMEFAEISADKKCVSRGAGFPISGMGKERSGLWRELPSGLVMVPSGFGILRFAQVDSFVGGLSLRSDDSFVVLPDA
jgi:hypothetical protein